MSLGGKKEGRKEEPERFSLIMALLNFADMLKRQ